MNGIAWGLAAIATPIMGFSVDQVGHRAKFVITIQIILVYAHSNPIHNELVYIMVYQSTGSLNTNGFGVWNVLCRYLVSHN